MHKITLFALVCLTSVPFTVLKAMERPLKRLAPDLLSTSEQADMPFSQNTFNSTMPSADYHDHPAQADLNRRLLAATYCPYSFAGDVIESLISRGSNPNTRNIFGDSALHLAVDARNFFSVKALIEGGAQPNVLNIHHLSPLHCAVGTKEEKTKLIRAVIIKYLIMNGAKKWITPEYSPLKHAVIHGDKLACLSILSTLPPLPDSEQSLHVAILKELRQLKLELSLPDERNVTMQQDALQRGFNDIAALVDKDNTQQFTNMLLGSYI